MVLDEKQAEYLRGLTKANTPNFPFDVIETKIVMLRRDMQILDKHPEDFIEELRKYLEERHIPLGDHLTFYVIQEIQDFYRLAREKFGDKITFPETFKDVQKFRGAVVAHIKVDSGSEIAEMCIELEKKGGFDKIYSDWQNFKTELYEKIKKKELIL